MNPYAENLVGCVRHPAVAAGLKMASVTGANPITQINWGIGYIRAATAPAPAWAHSNAVGWY